MYPVEGAVIACAGLGSRLGMGLPKCLIEVGGRTVLSRLIDSLRPRVSRIHVVVGYREELIIDYCERHHRDVVIVRNPDYRQTNTAHSLVLGSVGFARKVLYLDGDLIIDDESLERFITRGGEADMLVGITKAKSTQAVFVTTHTGSDGDTQVLGFHRKPPARHEWANIFVGSPRMLHSGTRYVYECISTLLPAQAQEVRLFEIDTPEDLENANVGVTSFSVFS